MSRGEAYLLDSHALLWWWFDPDRLSTAVSELLGPLAPCTVKPMIPSYTEPICSTSSER